jgi:hypothetical protein
LQNYQGGGITTILVPIPMVNGEQEFSDEELQSQSFGRWRSVSVSTQDGKMLALQTEDKNLSDIDAKFFKPEEPGHLGRPIQSVILSPVLNKPSMGGSDGMCTTDIITEYTTMVFSRTFR